MKALLYKWRYYGLGRDEYNKYMEKTFYKNISGLRWANALVAVLAAGFTIVPVVVGQKLFQSRFLCYNGFFCHNSIYSGMQYFA